MNSKYKVLKFSSKKFEQIDDLVSIEEPLEISLKFKKQDNWIIQNLSITMRTPGNDEDLVRGFLFNEQIVKNIKDIDSIESYGDKVGQYNIQNKILATLNNSQNVNISKIKKDFLTNSSCGVCGKSSLDALEIIKKDKTNSSEPQISKEVILQSPKILKDNQSEFSKTGGIHASGLFNNNGEKYFRNIEETISLKSLKLNNKVIALGGGGYINPSIRKFTLKKCISVWLNWKNETLINRIKNSKKRPLVIKLDNLELEKLIIKRSTIYNLSDYKINCDKLDKRQIVEKIIKLYENS